MGLTFIVVTGDAVAPDGGVPTGEVEFQLQGTITDTGDLVAIAPRTVVAEWDENGKIAQPLAATTTAGASPATAAYFVTERVTGSPDLTYYTAIPAAPAGSRTVTDAVVAAGLTTLTSASASFTSADVGAYVAVPGVPIPATIVAVQSATAATLSVPATVGGSGLTCIIGASVDLSVLRVAAT